MPNPASVEDIERRWRPLSAQETTNALAFLDDAWSLLLSLRPSLESDVLAGDVLEGNVIRVVAAMVVRLLRNPDGYASESIGSYSYSRDQLVASGQLHVTPEELAGLTPGGVPTTRSLRMNVYEV